MRTALLITLTAAALGSMAGPATAATPAVKLGCDDRSEAPFPGAFADTNNLLVGPLVLVLWRDAATVAAAELPVTSSGEPWWKMPLLVRDGRRVTVRIAAPARARARLDYGHTTGTLADQPAQIRFTACSRARGERSGSNVDGKPVTFWSGGIVVTAAPACVPVEIRHDRSRVWRTRVLKVATTSC